MLPLISTIANLFSAKKTSKTGTSPPDWRSVPQQTPNGYSPICGPDRGLASAQTDKYSPSLSCDDREKIGDARGSLLSSATLLNDLQKRHPGLTASQLQNILQNSSGR